MFIILYATLTFALAIYSFALIDPNITFFQHPLWVAFRDPMVQFGYYNREGSWWVYFILVILLSVFSFFAVKYYKKINAVTLALVIGGILLFSYPFLSHDFFNYMFDAKIFTYYHQNPYFQKALDYPMDQWTRFMHWTHRTYPYGPIFLFLSFIPAFLGFGKFALSFLLFKAFFISCYLISVYLLNKLDKKWAVIFATSPLIIIEGIVSSHNDVVAVVLGIIGVYFIFKKKKAKGVLFFLLSAGIKYITLPVVLLSGLSFRGKTEKSSVASRLSRDWISHFVRNDTTIYFVSFIFQLIILGYLSLKMEIQPWYFLSLFIFLPFFPQFIERLQIFFFGLLMSYYPYIRLGGWDTAEKVNMKHQIILIFFVINVFYLLLQLQKDFKKAKK